MTINKFLYELYMLNYGRIDVSEELMLIREANQKSVMLVTNDIFRQRV